MDVKRVQLEDLVTRVKVSRGSGLTFGDRRQGGG